MRWLGRTTKSFASLRIPIIHFRARLEECRKSAVGTIRRPISFGNCEPMPFIAHSGRLILPAPVYPHFAQWSMYCIAISQPHFHRRNLPAAKRIFGD
jgi:hypothetical protein